MFKHIKLLFYNRIDYCLFTRISSFYAMDQKIEHPCCGRTTQEIPESVWIQFGFEQQPQSNWFRLKRIFNDTNKKHPSLKSMCVTKPIWQCTNDDRVCKDDEYAPYEGISLLAKTKNPIILIKELMHLGEKRMCQNICSTNVFTGTGKEWFRPHPFFTSQTSKYLVSNMLQVNAGDNYEITFDGTRMIHFGHIRSAFMIYNVPMNGVHPLLPTQLLKLLEAVLLLPLAQIVKDYFHTWEWLDIYEKWNRGIAPESYTQKRCQDENCQDEWCYDDRCEDERVRLQFA